MATPTVRLISFGESSGGSLTISTGIVAGDYVALVYHRSNASAANEALPAWLELLGASSGGSQVGPQHVGIYAGVAPTSIASIIVPEGSSARAMLIAVQDAHLGGIQRTSIVGPSADPLPGLEVAGGSLLLLLQSRWYSDVWGSPRPGERITSRREGSSWSTEIDARVISGDTTGPIGRTPSITGSYAAGMAIALPLHGVPDADRTRASVSEDAGSLFQATQAVAVELGLSEAFAYGEDVGAGLRAFREALTPDEVAVSYYPLPTRNQEMLTTVEGETNLGRLAHTIAPRIFSRGASIVGNVGGVVTAQQAIQHVVNRWSSEHSWLTFEPIPDLRVLMPEAVSAPRQYYVDNPSAGVLTTSNVVIEQEGNDRRTMREVLDEWLQIFPGTIVRQTSAGTIELVPRVGPDAPDGATLTLSWRDLARMSDGENDPRGIYNRARVTSQGWDWSEDTPLAPPYFIFSAASNGLQRSVLESEEVMPSAREETWLNSITPFTVMNDGAPVTVDLLITAFGSWSTSAASNFSVEGTAPHQFTIARGQRRDVAITHNTRGANVTSRWRFERLAVPGPDVLYVTPLNVQAGGWNVFGSTYVAYLLEFDVTGMAWTKSNEQVTSEFGQSGDHVPAEGGGNALDQSRSLYGERTATINSTVFQLDSTQARQVAESFVLHNINPRTIREVQQSEWDRYLVKFDHIGRYVELPNGEVAVVENRAYSDSFSASRAAMMSTFTATVSHSVIDTTTEYLFNSDGSYWENDDGTISEVL